MREVCVPAAIVEQRSLRFRMVRGKRRGPKHVAA